MYIIEACDSPFCTRSICGEIGCCCYCTLFALVIFGVRMKIQLRRVLINMYELELEIVDINEVEPGHLLELEDQIIT